MKYIHFVDNTAYDPENDPFPKLFKLKPVLDYLFAKFKSVYTPERNISIDESLMLWKGRLSWKQYIPIKRDRFGIKSFELCESSSGYVWNSVVYTGKGTNLDYVEGDLVSEKVVLKLAEDLFNKGYRIHMDNYYSSPALFSKLIKHQTDAVGTVRLTRKCMPDDLKKTKLKKGECIARQHGKILAVKWKDKKDVTMLSTVHGNEMKKVKVKVKG